MEAGHLQECNKQLFEDQLRRIIVEAKERVLKAKSHPGAESTGERAVLETQISSENVSVGVSSQQVMCMDFYWLDCHRLIYSGILIFRTPEGSKNWFKKF